MKDQTPALPQKAVNHSGNWPVKERKAAKADRLCVSRSFSRDSW